MFFRDTSEKQLNAQLQLVKEQTELLENQKISVELNDKLKKDNLILKQRNEDLEKTNRDIMEGLNKNKLSQNEIQVEKEIQFQEMCNNYDKVSILSSKLNFFNEKSYISTYL